MICFFIAESKKRNHYKSRSFASNSSNNYGKFTEDGEELDAETEAVIGTYFRIMERIRYKSASLEDQNQCRLCLQFFKEDENIMKIPLCEHIFHIGCLKKWLIDY